MSLSSLTVFFFLHLQRMGDLWLMLIVESFGVSLVDSLLYLEKQLMMKTKLTLPISKNYSGNIVFHIYILSS